MAFVATTNRYRMFLLIGDSAIVLHGVFLACLGALLYSADIQKEDIEEVDVDLWARVPNKKVTGDGNFSLGSYAL